MKSILVPTDFSDTATNAVLYAAQFCKDYGVSLHILNVMHVPAVDANAQMELANTLLDNTKSATEVKLQKVSDKVVQSSGIIPEMHSHFGLGSDVIIEQAMELGVDFVMMGTSGESGFIRSLLGSVTLAVSRNSEVPVIAIPQNAQYNGLDIIVYGNDHKEKIEEKLDLLAPFTRVANARIDMISVEPEAEAYAVEVVFEEPKLKEVSIWDKTVSEGVQKYLEKENANLLVLKHHERSFIQELFQKSTTKELLKECSIPVLILN
ncbi:MAG: universal stress protein [Bacteroidia bacterium]